MKLTKNEKLVLKMLLKDASLTDSFISKKLKISSQAVGRIRKRLEENIISNYNIKLKQESLGLHIQALLKISLNSNIKDFDVKQIEERLKNLPEITLILKTLSGTHDYVLLTSFSNMDELEKFITEKRDGTTFDSYCIIKELITIPNSRILKQTNHDLLEKMIDKTKTKKGEIK